MPVTVGYPGVYVQELPSGVHEITGVATSITAFIGSATCGPVNVATKISSYSDYKRTFGDLSQSSSMSFAVSDFYDNGGSQAVIVRLTHEAGTAVFSLPEDGTIASSPFHGALPATPFSSLNLMAANAGVWANNLCVLIDHKIRDPNDLSSFNLTLTLMDSSHTKTIASEMFPDCSVDPRNARYIVTVLKQHSLLAAVQAAPSGIFEVPGKRPAETYRMLGAPPTRTAVLLYGKDGNDGAPLVDDDFIGPQKADQKQGLYALEQTDLFNLLCIPPYAGNDVTTRLVGQAASYCERRRAFYIVDPPSAWTDLRTVLNKFSSPTTDFVGTRSANAAIYFPRIRKSNPLRKNQLQDFAPSGAIAGLYARTDAARGVWKAPAGQDASISGAAQLTVKLTDNENGQLNPLGVNCLRTFPIFGNVVWGSRTLRGADTLAEQYKYVPVRRTQLFLEASIDRGTRWAVFEPNNETLWQKIRLNVGAFLQNLFVQGAFAGSTANQAYFVKCDSETTTQADIDRGVINILVGFAPLKPAEFIVVKIQQTTGDRKT
jgi:phage tail sheath protein FI